MDDIQKAMLLTQIKKVDRSNEVKKPLSNAKTDSQSSSIDFDKILDQNRIQFSKHAEKRLLSRNIELTQAEKTKLQDAVGSLQKKGAKDSLVLMGDLAFIVNVPSKTVVTALQKDQMKEQVFTNIDSTMLV